MSLQTITSNIEKCNECKENISTLFCKECNSYLCQKCWDVIHNSNSSHNINKSHLPPSQLVIPIKDILSIIQFNKIIKYEGKFRNGFHNPNDSPKIVSSPKDGLTLLGVASSVNLVGRLPLLIKSTKFCASSRVKLPSITTELLLSPS